MGRDAKELKFVRRRRRRRRRRRYGGRWGWEMSGT
jgi:hypothetical protein